MDYIQQMKDTCSDCFKNIAAQEQGEQWVHASGKICDAGHFQDIQKIINMGCDCGGCGKAGEKK